MKILIVDDSPLVRAILKDYLNEAGYEIFEASTYKEAETQFKKLHPELVIKDLYMPDWDAIESIHFFRRIDSKVKIVICSTDSAKATIIEGLKAGAHDFVLKPLDKAQVITTVKRLALS